MMWWILAITSLGMAQDALWYDTTRTEMSSLTEKHRAGLVAEVDPILRADLIVNRVTWIDEKGAPTVVWPGGPDVASLPLVVLGALSLGIQGEMAGVERDTVVVINGKGILVTLSDDGNRHWTIAQGAMFPKLPKKPPTTEQMQSTFGTGEFQERDGTWDPISRHIVNQGLGLLSDTERIPLNGVAMVRAPAPPPGFKNADAMYHSDDTVTEMRFFDLMVVKPTSSFVGPLNHPYPNGVYGVVHETGHAIERYPYLAAHQAYMARFNAQNAAASKYNALIEAYNAAVEALNNASAADQPDLVVKANAISAELDEQSATVASENAAVEAALTRVKQLQKGAPVIAAFLKAKGSHPGVTEYSRTSAEESFAEAFALFKIDPDALKRIHPDLLAWFEAGGHLTDIK